MFENGFGGIAWGEVKYQRAFKITYNKNYQLCLVKNSSYPYPEYVIYEDKQYIIAGMANKKLLLIRGHEHIGTHKIFTNIRTVPYILKRILCLKII